MTVAWRFDELLGGDSYVFHINPNEMSSPVPSRPIQWDRSEADRSTSGGYSGKRKGREPHPWSFSGVIRSEAQDLAFKEWVNKRRKITVSTDLGQVFVVRLLAYKPRQQALPRNRHAPYRHTYSIECLIFEEVVT